MAQHVYEMALTRAEFMRLLPVAVQAGFEVSGDEVRGQSDEVAWRIALAELEPRRIALLTLPRLKVTVQLDTCNPSSADEWLRRFLLGYQRAGG